MKASTVFFSSLIFKEEIFAGLNALVINNWVLLVKLITSMFSFPSSLTIPWILDPFIPTQAPTGSILSSYESTATFAFSPGILTTFLTEIRPSNTSGISCSKSFSKNFGEVLEKIIDGLLPFSSTDSITPLTESPFL